MKYTENIVHQVGFICKHYKYVYVKSPCILETCEHKFTENLSACKCNSFIDNHNTAIHWQSYVWLDNSFSSRSGKTTYNLIPSSVGTNCTEQRWASDCVSRDYSTHGMPVDTEIWYSKVGGQPRLQVRPLKYLSVDICYSSL